MLQNILPPGPRAENGKTIRIVSSGSQMFWFNSNKVISYNCEGNQNEIFAVQNQKITAVRALVNNNFLIGNQDGELILVDKDKCVQFKKKLLDGDITTIIVKDEFLWIAGGRSKKMICHCKISNIQNDDMKDAQFLNDAKRIILCGAALSDNTFAFSGEDSCLYIYNEKLELVHSQVITNSFVNSMLQMGDTLVLGSFVGTIILFDLKKNQIKQEIPKATTGGIYQIVSHSENQFLAVSSGNKLYLWEDFQFKHVVDLIQDENKFKDKSLGLATCNKKIYTFTLLGKMIVLDKDLNIKNKYQFFTNEIIDITKYNNEYYIFDQQGSVAILDNAFNFNSFYSTGKSTSAYYFDEGNCLALNYSTLYKLNTKNGLIDQQKIEISGVKFIQKLDGFYYFINSNSVTVMNEMFKKIKDFKLQQEPFCCILVDENICLGNKNGSVQIFDKNFNLITENKPTEHKICSLAYEKDNIAIGCQNGMIYIYDKNLQNKIKYFDNHDSSIRHMIVQNNLLTSVGFDNQLCVFDLQNYKNIRGISLKRVLMSRVYCDSEVTIIGQENGAVYIFKNDNKQVYN